MIEIWRDICDYEGLYEISNKGNVKNKKTNRILKPSKKKNGYLYVQLTKNKVGSFKRINRLVAQEFIKKIEGKEYVNHKDGNKFNNNADNLEWVTASENTKHAFLNNLIKHYKVPVIQYDLNMNYIKKWRSIRQASKELGICESNISMCCRGQYRKAGGYIWKYIKKETSFHNHIQD